MLSSLYRSRSLLIGCSLRSRDRVRASFTAESPNQPKGIIARFWNWTTQPRPTWRENKVEAAVVFTVFGITGSTSVAFVRPCLKNIFGLEGNMRDGPWSYRIISLLAVSPIYACFLLSFGTLAGRHNFFAMMSLKIFGRFMPASVSRRLGCPPSIKKIEANK